MEKCKFHDLENLIFLYMEEIKGSSIVFSGEKDYKFLIVYKDDDHKIKAFCMMLPLYNA